MFVYHPMGGTGTEQLGAGARGEFPVSQKNGASAGTASSHFCLTSEEGSCNFFHGGKNIYLIIISLFWCVVKQSSGRAENLLSTAVILSAVGL